MIRALFRRRCPARAVAPEGTTRCDLPRGHSGVHSADRGMYDVAWSSETWAASKGY